MNIYNMSNLAFLSLLLNLLLQNLRYNIYDELHGGLLVSIHMCIHVQLVGIQYHPVNHVQTKLFEPC